MLIVQPKPSSTDNFVWLSNLYDEGTLRKRLVLVRQSALDPIQRTTLRLDQRGQDEVG